MAATNAPTISPTFPSRVVLVTQADAIIKAANRREQSVSAYLRDLIVLRLR